MQVLDPPLGADDAVLLTIGDKAHPFHDPDTAKGHLDD
jgi:hypothetical protein